MKILYTIKDMPPKKKSLCLGDLIRYYGETKYKTLEHIQKLQQNKTMAAKLVNSIRKLPNNQNFTIDIILQALETASSTQIFDFKIDGISPNAILKEGKDVAIEIYMNPLYFTTKAVMYQAFPGFRSKHDNIEVAIKKENDLWVKWFERELRGYSAKPFEKTILEE